MVMNRILRMTQPIVKYGNSVYDVYPVMVWNQQASRCPEFKFAGLIEVGLVISGVFTFRAPLKDDCDCTF